MTHAEFAAIVDSLCSGNNCSVTSWHRSKKRNTAVGGHRDSYHLRGLAVDVAFDTPADRAKFVGEAKAFPLDVIPYDSHVHIEPSPTA